MNNKIIVKVNNEQQNNSESKKINKERSASNKTEIFSIGKEFKLKDFAHIKDRKYRNGQGKRTTTKSYIKRGRYIYPTMVRKNNDFALDATIRAAAPYQKSRKNYNLAININSDDIREKVRQKKISNLILFVVDASGSMGANKRMVETKGAILSLLKQSYIKRDKVGLVVFRNEEGKLILPPNNSVERSFKLLKTMETGGKTPLNSGIIKAYYVIEKELRRNPNLLPMMVIITDGKGNISIDKNLKPKEELLKIASTIRDKKKINSMVIDIEKQGLMNFGIAENLASTLGAKYIRIDDLKKESIIEQVKGGILNV